MSELLDLFVNRIYNPEKHRLDVFFDDSFNPLIDLESFGHDIEASWLIDKGVDILESSLYLSKMRPITDDLARRVYEYGMDPIHGSVYMESENGDIKKTRNWWTQCEAIVGLYNAFKKDETKVEYEKAVEDIWDFIKTYLVDQRAGFEWIQEVDVLNQAVDILPVVGIWKCPYHNTRMCLEMIKRTKKSSTSFELPKLDFF